MFYFVKFTHKETKKSFHKFGITNTSVENRFSTKYDTRYSEFDIKVIDSVDCLEEDALKIECHFLSKYPKNFMLETYLDKPYNYYNKLSGITETVILENFQGNDILESINQIKKINLARASKNWYITSGKYLNINKKYLDSTNDVSMNINSVDYSIDKLKNNIQWKDNDTVYRYNINYLDNCKLI